MASILAYLHSQTPPIVHRDFTPDNLLLRSDGQVVLIDFNVAEQLEAKASSNVAGKPSYIPPEQFRGEATPQSDIYALGATLFFLLTGHDPEPLSSSHPASENSQVPQGLDDLVARATAPDTKQRYKDSEEFCLQLDAISCPTNPS